MTKNQIIAQLFTGKNFNQCIAKMEPDYLRDDLKQEIALIVCEWPEEKIVGLHERKELEFYVVRVILNQVNSSTSPFFKKYRMVFTEFDTGRWDTREAIHQNLEVGEVVSSVGYDHKMSRIYASAEKEDLAHRQAREEWEDTMKEVTQEQLQALGWYKAELVRLYFQEGSYRAIEKLTGIPHTSIYKTIKDAMATLKANLNQPTLQPLFSKEERNLIQG